MLHSLRVWQLFLFLAVGDTLWAYCLHHFEIFACVPSGMDPAPRLIGLFIMVDRCRLIFQYSVKPPAVPKVSVAGIEQLASDLLPSRQFGHLVLYPGCSGF